MSSRHTPRGVATIFGKITAGRMAYRAPGVANLHLLDEVLSLPASLYSDGLGELCALAAARGSFVSAAQALERVTGVKIGTWQLIGLVRAGARDADAFYRDRAAPRAPRDVLVITADGKGVVVLPDALRPGTAKAAKKNGASSGNRKRIVVEIVCVHELAPVPRTADDLIPPAGAGGEGTGRGRRGRVKAPVAAGKWLAASIIDGIPTVIAAGFDEAARRDPAHERTWIVLVDGNTTQIEAITAEAARRQVNITVLVDFLHVSGYAWGAAKGFLCTETSAGWPWPAPGSPNATG